MADEDIKAFLQEDPDKDIRSFLRKKPNEDEEIRNFLSAPSSLSPVSPVLTPEPRELRDAVTSLEVPLIEPGLRQAPPPTTADKLLSMFTPAEDDRGIDPSLRAAADIKLAAKEEGLTVEEFRTPTGAPLRRVERFLDNVGKGTVGTLGSALGAVDLLIDSDVARDLSNKTRGWLLERQEEDPDLSDAIAQGLGSSAVFFIPGLGISRGVGAIGQFSVRAANWAGVAVSTVLEAGVEAGETFNSVLRETKNRDKAEDKALGVFLANIPLNAVTNRLGVFADKGGSIKKAVASSLVESAQEIGQSFISQTAQDKDISTDQLIESGVVGFSTGILTGGLGGAILPQETAPFKKDGSPIPTIPQEPAIQEAESTDINAPSTPNNIMRARELLASEEGSIPLGTLIPGLESIEQGTAQARKARSALSRLFTRFKELDNDTRQSFIQMGEIEGVLKELGAKASAELFAKSGLADEQISSLYDHLQEPNKFPQPEGTDELKQNLTNLLKWHFFEVNKIRLPSKKKIRQLADALKNDKPIPQSLLNDLVMPKYPDNRIVELGKQRDSLQLRLESQEDPDAQEITRAEIDTIDAQLLRLSEIKYFHQISTPTTKSVIRGLKKKIFSGASPSFLGRTFPTRRDAQEAGFKTASLPTAVADMIYDGKRVQYMNDFIGHVNRNDNFSVKNKAQTPDKTWRQLKSGVDHKFPASRGRWYHPSVAEAIEDLTVTADRSTLGIVYDRTNSTLKMIGFYNPLFMARFNASQGFRAAGFEHFKQLPAAIKIWRERGDIYQHLRKNGLFNNVFDLTPAMEDITTQMLNEARGIKKAPTQFQDVARAVLNPIKLARTTHKFLNEGTWKIDEAQRIATYLALKKNKRINRHYSDFQIIELANDFHANYAKVPKRTRQALNRAFFTPTYKISMARVMGRMIKESPVLWPALLRHMAMKIALTSFIPAAFNAYMKHQGIEKKSRVDGYRFIVRTRGKQKETVFSLSDPSLELTKIRERPLFRTLEFNLASIPAAILNFIAGPTFRDKDDPEWVSSMNAFFKTGTPVIKELLLIRDDDLETYQKIMQGFGLAFIYKRNKQILPEESFRKQFLKSIDLWVEWRKLNPKGRIERRFIPEKES